MKLMIQQEAALSILRTAELIHHECSAILKPFDLTTPQFNILRILRGAPDGLSCGQIAERMVNRDPDVTRLLDRMEARGLIVRERSDEDRRVITSFISQAGLEVLQLADPAISRMHERQFHDMSERQLIQMIKLVEQIRPLCAGASRA